MSTLEFPATPTDGEIYGNYQWDDTVGVWKLLSEMTPALEDLTDTDITTPTEGDTLIYDGSVSGIPVSENNSDYQEYLAWLAEGNEPEVVEENGEPEEIN